MVLGLFECVNLCETFQPLALCLSRDDENESRFGFAYTHITVLCLLCVRVIVVSIA